MKTIFWVIFLSISSKTGFTQSSDESVKIYALVGAGLPETFHCGIRVDFERWHFDSSYGNTLGGLFTVNGNAAYHFGSEKTIDKNSVKPWFANLGLSYMHYESSQAEVDDLYLNGRIGRDLLVGNRLRFGLCLGLGVNVYHFKYDKDPGGWDLDIWLPIIPSGRFSINYMLFKFGEENN